MTRKEAIQVLKEYRTIVMNCLEAETPAYDMAIEALQAEPVKHGEWIDHGTTCQRYECSECGDQHDWLILPNNINFCPNCGAKMKGEQDD